MQGPLSQKFVWPALFGPLSFAGPGLPPFLYFGSKSVCQEVQPLCLHTFLVSTSTGLLYADESPIHIPPIADGNQREEKLEVSELWGCIIISKGREVSSLIL